jgi:HAMP domain-containing protein
MARTAARRDALRRLVEVFFAGSPHDTVAALLRQEDWTDDELDALAAEIRRVRKERKQP